MDERARKTADLAVLNLEGRMRDHGKRLGDFWVTGKRADAAKNIKDHADKLNMERSALAAIARHLEERDARSK